MATLGNTAEPSDSAEAWSNSYNHLSLNLTMPSGGPWLITHVGVWAAGYGASPSAKCGLWDSGGTLLAESASFTLTQRTFGVGNTDLYNKALGGTDASRTVAGGTVVKVGFGISPLTSGMFVSKEPSGAWSKKDNTSGFLGSMASATAGTGGKPGFYLTYVAANSLPAAPTWSSPAAGAIVGDTTPDHVFVHNDADGDPVTSWDLQIDTTTGNGVEPDWATLSGSGREDLVNQTSGISGDTITYTPTTKNRNQWYAARSRTADAVGDGAWSATRFYFINQLPSVSSRNPG